jgi:hypothetical protein
MSLLWIETLEKSSRNRKIERVLQAGVLTRNPVPGVWTPHLLQTVDLGAVEVSDHRKHM